MSQASVQDKFFVKNEIEIKKGKGTKIFEIKATPTKWDNKNFEIRSSIHIQSPLKIISSDGQVIQIEK
jgi:hypothetical protein